MIRSGGEKLVQEENFPQKLIAWLSSRLSLAKRNCSLVVPNPW